MKYKKMICCITASLSLLLYGCTKDLPPGSYDAAEVGKLKKVVPGIIISKRPIHIYANKSENVAKSTESAAMPEEDHQLLGSGVKRKRGYEYVVKLNSGDIVSIAQDEDLRLKVKQHILVIYGSITRIVPDEGSDDN